MENLYECDDLNFTNNDLNVLYDTVDNSMFLTMDSSLIYTALQKKLVQRPFCDYLKRYICRKAGLECNWKDIPLNDYRRIIIDAFEENNTPASFVPTTAKLSALSKNWLTQSTVKRQVVFLLGFGLRMSTEDVSAFLIKALHEQDINPKNPFELICWYCYQHHYGYAEYRQLKESFEKIPPKRHRIQQIYSEGTVSIRNSYTNIHDDSVFLSRLAQMKTMDNTPLFSYTARQQFEKLYFQTQTIIADYFNRNEEERLKWQISEYLRANAYNTKLSDADKAIHIEKMRSGIRVYSEEDISAGDVEKVICSAIPMDRNGNLGKSSFSSLNAQFKGRRFSRQHITEILQHNIDVDRFDLITLNFFIYSQKTTELPDPKTRFLKFCDDTNAILRDCSMGEILTTNPYECFLMMCMLSEDPLGTYADVIEMSYDSSDR
ncbi:MAG: hypothetical protein KIG74_07770 [Clostridiaceae bacterium]|nr:hypothetical protein [Clostridiaceae bacterium]